MFGHVRITHDTLHLEVEDAQVYCFQEVYKITTMYINNKVKVYNISHYGLYRTFSSKLPHLVRKQR